MKYVRFKSENSFNRSKKEALQNEKIFVMIKNEVWQRKIQRQTQIICLTSTTKINKKSKLFKKKKGKK